VNLNSFDNVCRKHTYAALMPERNQIMASANPNPVGTVYRNGNEIPSHLHLEETEQRSSPLNESIALCAETDSASTFEGIVGSSGALRKVLLHISKVATADCTVLILGESGTGKELVARAIHKRSNRASRPFIGVNCASIPDSLIASELFGHEKGAFTGASQRRIGRFEAAQGGTLFLDEIGDISMETQIALLRVLQEREVERIGSSQPIKINVRVLAATNRDLKAMVAAGKFREDLYYRLNVFPIQVPALRERLEDITLLIGYLTRIYARHVGKEINHIDKKTLTLFREYRWPGNVRELQNMIERAVVLCDDATLSVDETWLTQVSSREPPSTALSVQKLLRLREDQEKEMIETALAECRGRLSGPSGAADKLGIPRQTLASKIANLGINKYRFMYA
jgi:formate hydrogenlyase transcriptional activator